MGEEGYLQGQAISESGKIKGPWKQSDKLIFDKNGGHGMLFKTFEGKSALALHQPNSGGPEHLKLFNIIDKGDYLQLGEEMFK